MRLFFPIRSRMCSRMCCRQKSGKEIYTSIVNLDCLADKMDTIGVAVLLLFVFHVEKSAECSYDDIVAMAGCNVSLEWTLRNISMMEPLASPFIIVHSSSSRLGVFHFYCYVLDKSSTYCYTDHLDDRLILNVTDDRLILSLTIFDVTTRQSGNYTLFHGKVVSEEAYTSKKLVVVEKPKIIEIRKPIIGQLFELTCSSPLLEYFVYKWKISGTEIILLSNVNAHFVSSALMTDNFRHVTCQVCLNETATQCSSVICKHDACSADSDPYTIQVISGPDNISLSRHESHFYLQERECFTIDCFASCNPNCTFVWKGHDTVESAKLVITGFESRMAGDYICYVTNQQTNITSKSNPITLHHAKAGPDNISLSRHESHFYLQEREYFTIDCFASCNPNCTFVWKGHDTVESAKLVITGFESRMAGDYICYVTNQQTNITSKSNPITLHHAKENKLKDEETGDPRLLQYWMGPVIVSVLLLIVGCLILVTQWRKSTTRVIVVADSRESCQSYVGQTDSEVSRKELGSSKTTLSIPEVRETASRRVKRLVYPNIHKTTRSLQNLSDPTKCIMNQVIENVPLQALSQASNAMKRQTKKHVNTDDSANNKNSSVNINWPSSMGGSANRSRLVKPFARIKKDNKVARDDHNIGAESRDLSNPREEYFGPKHQGDLYSTIDEDTLSVFYHATDKVTEKNSHESGGSTGHVFYDYADAHVTDEAYLTPVSDLTRQFEMCQDQENDMLETDHSYITPIDDLSNPIEVCQVEGIDMNETDPTYITPITG